MSFTSRFNPQPHPQNFTPFLEPSLKNLEFMFHQIKTHIKHLLDCVEAVYQNFRIIYPVQQYFDTVFRMLSPVQLLSAVNFSYVKGMFGASWAIEAIEARNARNAREGREGFGGITGDGVDCYTRVQVRKKRLRRSTFSRGFENLIQKWTMEKLSQGQIVTRSEIMEKARQLGKEHNFKACPSWCNKFLNRHPDIRQRIQQIILLERPQKIPTERSTQKVPSYSTDSIFPSTNQPKIKNIKKVVYQEEVGSDGKNCDDEYVDVDVDGDVDGEYEYSEGGEGESNQQ